ncbi:hypothetical protein L873DRAFT_1824267 [Choiromyces venosus 120613-1]|uniref:Uncharacterized protein n=1 Tax=Choiromyces venosus 120613-1 TaxID=1336337 RepID=A0A3N4IV11_9PEZI|nr:hypothetical protein L873DRAFT_1824267 [Choiromyces venosus 120613-1]
MPPTPGPPPSDTTFNPAQSAPTSQNIYSEHFSLVQVCKNIHKFGYFQFLTNIIDSLLKEVILILLNQINLGLYQIPYQKILILTQKVWERRLRS